MNKRRSELTDEESSELRNAGEPPPLIRGGQGRDDDEALKLTDIAIWIILGAISWLAIGVIFWLIDIL